MKKVLLFAIVAMLLGCDAGSSRDSTYEQVPAAQTGNKTITITSGGDTIIKDVIVTDDGTYIDCGVGGCGDIYIAGGDMYSDRVTPESNGSESIYGGDGTCPAGFVYCSIEDKCVPSDTTTPCGG